MTRFKLKPYEPLEGEIKRQVVESLRMDVRVIEVSKINCGKISTPGRRFGIYDSIKSWFHGQEPKTTGISDIHGQLCDGRYLVMEVKTKGGVFQDGQEAYVEYKVANGAVGGVVRSADEAIEIVRGAFR